MTPPAAPYVPVDCGFHDRLEAAVLCGAPVALVLDDGGERLVTARVLDVFARDDADWADVDGIGLVRLDAVRELGGVRRPGVAACAVRDRQ